MAVGIITFLLLVSRFPSIARAQLEGVAREPAFGEVVDLSRVTVISDKYSEPDARDYFGYTVALAQGLLSGTGWIFIGAPKSNITLRGRAQYVEPGFVWRCGLGKGNAMCDILHFTDQLCQDKLKEWDERKRFGTCDSSFMGGALTFDEGVMVTCAQNWRRVRKYDMSLRMDGACYWLAKEEALHQNLVANMQANVRSGARGTLIPFHNPIYNDPYTASYQGKVYRWYYATAGISAVISSNKDILIGVPGVLGGAGTVVKYNGEPQGYRQWKLSVVERPGNQPKASYLNLFGYSVTSGHYLSRNSQLFAASSPRADAVSRSSISASPEDMRGAVLIFREWELCDHEDFHNPRCTWSHDIALPGPDFGTYFGAALESVDINGDNLDDLIVGAPLAPGREADSSPVGDHGCIYIYSIKGQTRFDENPLKLCGKVPGGRFGTSIAKLGDINQDGYNDFAVGAPYEGGVGAVYVFFGREGRIELKVIRISGDRYQDSHIFPGFGYSITGGVDVDGNGTPDFAIGSYLTKQAFIFRTRPKLEIQAQLSFLRAGSFRSGNIILKKDERELKMRLCLSFTISYKTKGLRLHQQLLIFGRLVVDEQFQRFRVGGSSELELTFNFQKNVNQASCSDVTAERDVPEDLVINQPDVLVKYSFWYNQTNSSEVSPMLIEIGKTSIEGIPRVVTTGKKFSDFCANCPFPVTFDKFQPQKIPFRRECRPRSDPGSDPVCRPVLKLSVRGVYDGLDGLTHELVANTHLTLGESPKVRLQIQLQNLNQTAYYPRIALFWRWESSDKSVQLALPTLVEWKNEDLCLFSGVNVTCNVRNYLSKGQRTPPLDFVFSLEDLIVTSSAPMKLVMEVKGFLEGDAVFVPVQETFPINYKIDAQIQNFTGHLMNETWPFVARLSHTFYVNVTGISPVELKSKFLIPEKVIWNRKTIKLFDISPPENIKCILLDAKAIANDPELKLYEKMKDKMWAQMESKATEKSGPKLIKYGLGQCQAFTCTMSIPTSRRIPRMEFALKISDSALTREILKEGGPLDIMGMASVKLFKGDEWTTVLSRVVVNPPQNFVVAAWIIIAAAVGGFILLFLVVLLLCKCGFFKRNTKEKLERLIAEAEVEDAENAIQSRYQDTSQGETPRADVVG